MVTVQIKNRKLDEPNNKEVEVKTSSRSKCYTCFQISLLIIVIVGITLMFFVLKYEVNS